MKPTHLFYNYIGVMLTLVLCLFLPNGGKSQILYKQQATLMGSVFEFTVLDQDSLTAIVHVQQAIAEVERIEDLISEWRPNTQISEINRNAGIQPVKVDEEVFQLTKRALQYSKMSSGAFDISIAALDKVWLFDGSMTDLPTAESIRRSVEKVGYQHIILDSIDQSIFLEKSGMKIGFGSIGKGYAADKVRELLQRLGVQSGIVNASGDIATWGSQPKGKPWKIGVNNPFRRHRMAQVIDLTEGAVATSGNYEKYAEIAGVRYAHIINPQTGYPATGLSSVTIYGPCAEFANALSTSSMVLGESGGKELIKRFPLYNFVFITDKGKIVKK